MSSIASKSGKTFFRAFILIVFSFYFYLAYQTPLTHDDWTWGSSEGYKRFMNWFEDYNGRYMGNFFELFLTRVYWLRFLIMAVFSTLLVLLAARQYKEQSRFAYILSLFLFLSVPVNVMSQTYAWVAGFSNYITSIVFILIYITAIKNIFEDEVPTYNKWLNYLVIPFAIASQLFMENATIYSIIMGLIIIGYVFLKFKKVYFLHIGYVTGAIVGAIIMFSNGAYSKIASGDDDYRKIGTPEEELGFFEKIWDVFSEQMSPMLFTSNIMLNIILAVFCLILLYKSSTKSIIGKIIKHIAIALFVLYPLYKTFILPVYQIWPFQEGTRQFEAIFSLLFFIAILLTVSIAVKNQNVKHRILFYLLSALLITAPLLFVHPFGPRNFIMPYTFFTMAAIDLGIYIHKEENFRIFSLNKVFGICAFLISLSLIYVFTMNGMVDRERMSYIHEQIEKGEKVITLTRLPHERYLWVSTPIIPSLQYDFFKEFHGIPEDIEFKVIPYGKWKEMNE
ncbi:DUF6056 family protein [Bacillus sp. EB01]|uniref:DUF6056 family protein n=1 Tax=Bacillus sp. EB01 TaxID=1347086 RepID=UPI0005C4B307|nr:DUF6056 family protein [Bacillus sp. EB01]